MDPKVLKTEISHTHSLILSLPLVLFPDSLPHFLSFELSSQMCLPMSLLELWQLHGDCS